MFGGRTLVIEPYGGLANRMRVAGSGLALAEKLGHRVKLAWYRNPELNCRFTDLFQRPEQVAALSQPKLTKLSKELRRVRARYYRRTGTYLNHKAVTKLRGQKFHFEDLYRCRNIYIRTYTAFYPGDRFIQQFRPVPDLQETISAVTVDFTDVVGVHIRRGDNEQSRTFSPTDHFIERMKEEIQHNQKIRFFLATDSPETQQQLQDLFGPRIITYPKTSLDRNNTHAIRDALVDLYCLAGCSRVLGSYWSSFTDLAALIGGITKVVVKSRD